MRYVFMNVVVFILSMVVSMLMVYLPVEKPALEARKAYSRRNA
jgi:hypothetical protein